MNPLSMRDGTAVAQHYLQQASALRLELLTAKAYGNRRCFPPVCAATCTFYALFTYSHPCWQSCAP